MGKWTDDQLQYLREHSRSQPAAAIAAALGRTEGSVRQKRRSLGLQSYHAGWTKAEEQFLQDQWGVMSIPAIAKRLNRSVEAVIVRKNRLGLGPVLFGGDYISMNQLIIAVCGSNAGGNYKLKSWVENRGLPIHTKRVNQNSFLVIRLNEFWKWAEQHRSFIDFSKMEPLALGEEPAWVAEQRKKDFQAFAIQRKISTHAPAGGATAIFHKSVMRFCGKLPKDDTVLCLASFGFPRRDPKAVYLAWISCANLPQKCVREGLALKDQGTSCFHEGLASHAFDPVLV